MFEAGCYSFRAARNALLLSIDVHQAVYSTVLLCDKLRLHATSGFPLGRRARTDARV